MIIDIEPTWESLCRGVSIGSIKDANILMPACKTADIIRQAQKRGAKSVTFTFEGNNANVEIVEKGE